MIFHYRNAGSDFIGNGAVMFSSEEMVPGSSILTGAGGGVKCYINALRLAKLHF